MLKGINSMKLNNKSDKVVQVNKYVDASVNTATYVKIGMPTHSHYNNDVSMSKAQYLFDTVNNLDLFNATNETIDFTRFVTIGQEPMICNCIKMHDIIDFYAHGCIQEFYDAFCESHSDSESITLARFLSAIGIEVWRDIVCYGGIYSGSYMVSNLGRVLSLYKNKQPKILKQYDNGYGYLIVKLSYNNKTQNVYVHRLVGLTFIKEPTEPLECCHSNTHRYDNRLFNLDLKTHLENVNNPITLKKYKDAWVTRAKADKESSAPTSTTV